MQALLVGVALSVGAPALKDPPKAEPPILGNWELVEWLQNGTKTAFAEGSGVEFLPSGKRLWRDGPGEVDERSYQLGPKASPAAIDLIRTAGGQPPIVHPCIFKIEGDTLTIGVGVADGDRPKTFEEARDRGYMHMAFKRVKKKD